jgi:acetolactate synthase I/II/III large subunit
MKASDLFIKALENEGVEYIFGIPGEENLDLLESLRGSRIELILTRHEQGAGFMAATYGRLTGKPGVCLATLGPGATNFVTPAAYAKLGAMPMLMITGQKPIKTSKQGRFQIVNIVDMMRPLTLFTTSIVDGRRIPSVVREAFRISQEERPGPVHIELPEDIASEEVKNPTIFEVVGSRRPAADEKSVAKAARMIDASTQPLLLIGAAANRKRTGEALKDFIENLGIPFFNTQMGKGVVDERHPYFLGTAALSDSDFLHHAIQKSDLIINVGHDIVEKPPFFMGHDGKKVIHVNFFSASVDEVYFPQLNVVGDIANAVERIGQQVSKAGQWDFLPMKEVKDQVDANLSKYFQDDRFPMLPQRLVHLLRKRLPDHGILALDNGVYKIWFARNYKAYQANTVLLDNALATMGAGLASAMAAKLIHPQCPVVAILGDGGFMMNSQELETAVRMGLNLVVIVLNDSSYGMIKWKQEGLGFPNWGLDYKNPDFVKYAESYGALGHRPTNDLEFKEILDNCIRKPGVHLIDLVVDYSLNHSILNVLLKEQVEQAKK